MDNFTYFVLLDCDICVTCSYDDFWSYVYNELPKDTHVKQFMIRGELISIFFYVNNKLVAFSVLSAII